MSDEKTIENKIESKLTPLPASAIKPGRGGGKRAFYTEYVEAIETNKLTEWIDEQLQTTPVIYVALQELANVCDMPLRVAGEPGGRTPTSIYWGFHYAFWKVGIWIGQATLKDNDERAVVIRYRTEKDRLSASLMAKLKAEEIVELLEEQEEQQEEQQIEQKEEQAKESVIVASKHLSISEKRKIAKGE
jgi:hypothetical protein